MIVLGKISRQVEKDTNGVLRCGDIRIDDFHLNVHIPSKHSVELGQLGIEPLAYVKYIVNNFTEIREGTHNSYLIVSPHNDEALKNVAAITMELVVNRKGGHYWEVRTAQPRSIKKLEKKDIGMAEKIKSPIFQLPVTSFGGAHPSQHPTI